MPTSHYLYYYYFFGLILRARIKSARLPPTIFIIIIFFGLILHARIFKKQNNNNCKALIGHPNYE